MSDENDYTQALSDVCREMFDEMLNRAPAIDELSEPDRVALASALTKVGLRSFRLGAAATSEQVRRAWREQMRPMLEKGLRGETTVVLSDDPFPLWLRNDEPDGEDVWATMFGGD